MEAINKLKYEIHNLQEAVATELTDVAKNKIITLVDKMNELEVILYNTAWEENNAWNLMRSHNLQNWIRALKHIIR